MDLQGNWVCSSIEPELWAVLSSLELAMRYNFSRIIVECDSAVVVYLLNNLQVSDDAESRLLTDISIAMN